MTASIAASTSTRPAPIRRPPCSSGARYDKMMEAFGGSRRQRDHARRAEARGQRGDGFGQAHAHQRGDRSGCGQRKRPHRQSLKAPCRSLSADLEDRRWPRREDRSPAENQGCIGTSPRQAKANDSLPQLPLDEAVGPGRQGARRRAILDFTHVQSGPTCTQLLAWFGADVIKVERPGVGDITRGQLQDVPNVDSLYFTMLNHNKRSITLDTKNPKACGSPRNRADEDLRRAGGEFRPRRARPHGLTWERIQSINPKMIVASIKGFGPGPYEDCKVYENVAQCAGGSASTTGFRDGPPLVTGAQIGDSGTGPAPGARHRHCALFQRNRTGRGQRVLARCRTACSTSPRQAARPAAPRPRPLKGIQPVRRGIRSAMPTPRAGNDPAAASLAASSNAGAGRPIPTPTSISSPRRRCGRRSAT